MTATYIATFAIVFTTILCNTLQYIAYVIIIATILIIGHHMQVCDIGDKSKYCSTLLTNQTLLNKCKLKKMANMHIAMYQK